MQLNKAPKLANAIGIGLLVCAKRNGYTHAWWT